MISMMIMVAQQLSGINAVSRIWGSHGGSCEEYNLMGYNAV
jgi:hypothetical protein